MVTARAIDVVQGEPAPVAALAARSSSALDRPLAGVAELFVGTATDEGVAVGAFDHARSGVRRGSGGAPVRVGPGSVWLQLALARANALADADPPRLVNRYVRPLLQALTKTSTLAHYFGRDWVSASRRPVAFVGFAHDATTGRCLVEAVVAVTTPFADPPWASFRDAAPATLVDLAPRADVARVTEAIVAAYAKAYGFDPEARTERLDALADVASGAPWSATAAEAIGLVGAGRDARGRLVVGGELMASRDAMSRLHAALAALDDAGRARDPEAVGEAIDACLGDPGAVVFGVRSLDAIRRVILEAA